MKKLKSSVIVISCVLLAGIFLPVNLSAETVIEEWTATYNGPGNSFDMAHDITVDASGNVYITGQISNILNDIATIKYDRNGNQLWLARYESPDGESSSAYAIVVDASGNVYVTGSSGPSSGWDCITIKYDKNGNQLWLAKYDSGVYPSYDSANAIALDSEGNVYVTGRVRFESIPYDYYDYATIKYDTDGNELWVARYNGPGSHKDVAYAIAVDSADNIYVTGESASDYATVKYDKYGNQLWVARYNGPGSPSDVLDIANDIALDSEGNVYVTGSSANITKYDYATVKYDTNGVQLWVARYDGPASDFDEAYAIAVDPAGNAYVTGKSNIIIEREINGEVYYGLVPDFATVKYDSSGNELWVTRYNGPADGWDSAKDIALDSAGNVYVAGISYGINTNGDCTTVKYDSSGNQLWVSRYDGPGYDEHSFIDTLNAIALDSAGNVYVTGYSYSGSETDHDWITIKYSQPSVLVLQLIQDVIVLNLKNGTANNLDGKLSAALRAMESINENDNIAAINTLEAFINAVGLEQSKGNISKTDADNLRIAAWEIIAIISGE